MLVVFFFVFFLFFFALLILWHTMLILVNDQKALHFTKRGALFNPIALKMAKTVLSATGLKP